MFMRKPTLIHWTGNTKHMAYTCGAYWTGL